jgi:1-acyl-sn-glycerol-3-phosphate acyltransferase
MKLLQGILSLFWKLYVGIIFAVFAIALYPFFYAILLNKKWKKASFKLFVFWSWLMRIFCFYRVKKVENAPLPDGPYIIVSNHSSYLDIFFMHSILPDHPFLFLGKGEILGYPIIRTYFKGLNIPVHRKDRAKAAKSFVMAKKAVNEGWSLVIFPEGTIPDDDNPKMIPFKAGAFKLAKALNIPIVPITFTNNYRLFSDPENLLGPARPGVSRVYIHPFISVEAIEQMTQSELSDHCFEVINSALIKEHPWMGIE